jgi:cyclase
MAVTKRIIPCLDIKDGKVVKGTAFVNLKNMGDPAELALRYSNEGADELVLLDITATIEKRKTLASVVAAVARQVNIPFTVGGGVNSIEDASLLLAAGADKIAVNSAAFKVPGLIGDLAKRFGSQCVVLAIDAKSHGDSWQVYVSGGKVNTGIDIERWVRMGVDRGAGEILLTSIDQDGARSGFDMPLVRNVVQQVNVPVIASGGAGNMKHFRDVLESGGADAALAAGVFHEGSINIGSLKNYLKDNKIFVR